MDVAPRSTIIRFGQFDLDPGSGQLSRLGRKIRLQLQSFQILTVLLDRSPQVVTRDQLQQILWPGDTHVDFEHGLNNAVKRLREALGDLADKPRFIETLPRKGYRFIGELRSQDPEPPAFDPVSVFRFAEFECDAAGLRTWPAGAPLPVDTKVLRLLLYFLENSSRPVPKQELLNRVWPESNLTESALTRAIAVLRKALNDDNRQPRLIETVPSLGYQFTAPVTVVPEAPPAPIAIVPEEPPKAHPSRSLWFRVWIFAIPVLLSVTVGVFFFRSSKALPLTKQDTIILADFTNKTGDPVFDETLRQGLAVQLAQSPFLSLVSELRIQQILRMMDQPENARLTPSVAREICERNGSTAVLDGSISKLGSQYVVGLRATNCRSGEILAEDQVRAAKKEDLLGALDVIAGKLRTRLGESLATSEKYDTPLADATTPSLEALKAFSLGVKKFYSSERAAGAFLSTSGRARSQVCPCLRLYVLRLHRTARSGGAEQPQGLRTAGKSERAGKVFHRYHLSRIRNRRFGEGQND